MFEKEIKFIVDYNLNKIKSLGSYLSFEKLAANGVHPAIVQYISGELDYLISEDRKKLLQQSVFDYSGAEIAKYFNLIAQEVKRSKKIAYEDLKNLVIQAASFNVNFLVRPRWSLTKLVYNEAVSKSTNDIKLTLNYIYYNDYLKNVFLSYLTKRKLDKLSLTEFESILGKIDREIISSDQQKMVDYSLYEIAEFFNPDSPDYKNGISKGIPGGSHKNLLPLYGVELFLKEKNLLEYLFKLKKLYTDTSKHKLEVEEIRKIIYSNVQVEPMLGLIEENHEPSFPEAKDKIKSETKVGKSSEEKQNFEKPVREDDLIQQGENNEIQISEKEIEERHEENGEIEATGDDFNFDSEIDEDLFSLYDEELKQAGVGETENEQENEAKKNDSIGQSGLDSLYDFEEETNQLLKEFEEKIPEETPEIEKVELNIPEPEQEKAENEDTTLLVENFMKPEEPNINNEPEEELTESPDDHQEEMIYEDKSNKKYLFDYISDKDIRKIISSVFNNDRDDFLSTADKIGECKNYEEATEILKSVFLTYRVNPYSKEAVALTNSVANFFNQA